MRCALALLVLFYASLSQADSFDDFRIPAHRTWYGQVDASGTGSWQASTVGPRQSNLQSDLNTQSQTRWDSEARFYAIGVGTYQTYRRFRSQEEIPPALTRSASHSEDIEVQFSGALREYPWKAPLGLSADLNSAVVRRWQHLHQTRTDPLPVDDNRTTRRDSARFVIGSIGTGWGRVRDATSVFDVEVLETRLHSVGVLKQPLSRPAREKLAQLFYIHPAFVRAHERPERFFWREVERIIRDDGALDVSGLDAESVLLALEAIEPVTVTSPVQLRGALRQRGSFAGFLFQGQHQWQKSVSEMTSNLITSSSVATFSRDVAWAGGQAEFHRPIGWRWQVDASSQYLVPVRSDEHGFRFRNEAGAGWQIADRWRSDVEVTQRREVFEARGTDLQQDSWNIFWGANLAYFLEDRTTVRVQFQQTQTKSDADWRRESQVLAGMEYRFLGRLDAPDLIAPERRLTAR